MDALIPVKRTARRAGNLAKALNRAAAGRFWVRLKQLMAALPKISRFGQIAR